MYECTFLLKVWDQNQGYGLYCLLYETMKYFTINDNTDTNQTNQINQTNLINNQSIIPSTDVIQLTLTLKMTTAQVVETSVTVKWTTVLFRTTLTRTIKLNLLKRVQVDLENYSNPELSQESIRSFRDSPSLPFTFKY